MLDLLVQMVYPIIGFLSIIVSLIVLKYLISRFLVSDEDVRRIVGKVFNIAIGIIALSFLCSLFMFTVSNAVPKRELKSTIKDDRSNYFEESSKKVLEDTIR